MGIPTVSIESYLDNIPNANIDNAEEPLVLLLELALVEDLNSKDAVLGDTATLC